MAAVHVGSRITGVVFVILAVTLSVPPFLGPIVLAGDVFVVWDLLLQRIRLKVRWILGSFLMLILILQICFNPLFLRLCHVCGHRSTREIFIHLVHFPSRGNSNGRLNPSFFELSRTLPTRKRMLGRIGPEILYKDLILLIRPLFLLIFLFGPDLAS